MRIGRLALLSLILAMVASTVRAEINWSQTLVIIIGNSANEFASDLPYAANDREAMAAYARDGLRAQQVEVFANAGSNTFENIFEPGGLIDAQLRGRNLLVYISAHGLVDPGSGQNSFLPANANPSRTSQLYTMNKVVAALERARAAQLGEGRERRVIALFDTCFSGKSRSQPDEAAFEGRASGLPIQPVDISQDISILSASDGIAYDDDAAKLGALTSGFLRAAAGLGDDRAFDGNRNRHLEGAELEHYLTLNLAQLAGSGLNQRADLSGRKDFALPLYAVAQLRAEIQAQRAEALLQQAEDRLYYLPNPLDYQSAEELAAAKRELEGALRPLRDFDRLCRRGGCDALAERRQTLDQRLLINGLEFRDQRAWLELSAQEQPPRCRAYQARCRRWQSRHKDYICLYAADAERECLLLPSPEQEHDAALLEAAKASGARGDWLACAKTCKLADNREEAATQIALIDQRQAELAKEQAALAKRKEEEKKKQEADRIAKLKAEDTAAWNKVRFSKAVLDLQRYIKTCNAVCAHRAEAQNSIGKLYEETKDDTEAVTWYRKAANLGYAQGQFNLGWMYEKGNGVPQDYAAAVTWYRKAADQGHARAQFNLGWMYEKGKGVPQSNTEAVKWYRKAADQGHAYGQNNLGWMYKEGNGVPQDYAAAVTWYRKAADQGHARAQFNLGWMYKEGKGVPQDYAKAVEWFRKAADQGHAYGQNNLGWMYERGKGVPQSNTEAVKWYRKAADQGNEYAKEALRRLGE